MVWLAIALSQDIAALRYRPVAAAANVLIGKFPFEL